jgi:hypothetical protein
MNQDDGRQDQDGKGESLIGYFLAMTHQRLGHPVEAHHEYEKATPWRMERNRTSALELRRFQAEAEALLGDKGR